MLRQKKTLRRLPKRARAVAEVANDLHHLSKRLHGLAEALATDEQVADSARVTIRKGAFSPECDEHKVLTRDCLDCRRSIERLWNNTLKYQRLDDELRGES